MLTDEKNGDIDPAALIEKLASILELLDKNNQALAAIKIEEAMHALRVEEVENS